MVKHRSGKSAQELFERGLEITYSDIDILNTSFSRIDKEDISLETCLGKDVVLDVPIIAAPMDTVASAELCIALALEGGIGAVHYNHKDDNGQPDIGAQIKEIERVKRFQSGLIASPVTLAPEATIEHAIEKGRQYRVGQRFIDTFPVTENGEPNGRLVGLLRKQDYLRARDAKRTVSERMLKLGDKLLVVGRTPITLKQAEEMLWAYHLLHLPIVDKHGNLKYLATKTDLEKREDYPNATRDSSSRLRVLFAVDTWRERGAHERLEAGFGAGADGVIIDTSQGFTKHERSMAEHIRGYIRKRYPDKIMIGGNISTPEAAAILNGWGFDAYRCGQGSGSICTTAGALGIARAGAAGVYDCSRALRGARMKTIADGGLREVGDIVKALAIGAHSVMLGNMLAGTDESPGEVTIDSMGQPAKTYRGMGSKEANVGGIRGYSKLPQGVSGMVPQRGSVHTLVPLIKDGMLSAFQAMNCFSIEDLHRKLYAGKIRFGQRTAGAVYEAGVHDLKR